MNARPFLLAAWGVLVVGGQFHAALDAEETEGFADGRVRDLVNRRARLDLAIDDAQAMLEEGRQETTTQVAILVDGGCEDGPAVRPIPAGVIGAAAKEGEAEGGSADDHSLDPFPATAVQC